MKVSTEECDDGNLNEDDGCLANCNIAPGWTCEEDEEMMSHCLRVCGNGN
jgi:cysteine-rich repeat protein